MLWGLSLQFWQTVVFWLWFVAAATGAIAVAASFGSSVISYYISDETQRQADKEIARANAIAGQANEGAGKANEAAAALRLRVVEGEQALEKERIARLDLQQHVAWRSLSEQQIKILSEGIKSINFNYYLTTHPGDPEAGSYYFQLWDVLSKTGKVRRFTTYEGIIGIAVATLEEEKAAALMAVFHRAGIPLVWVREFTTHMGGRQAWPDLIVGSKPPINAEQIFVEP